jgi:heavy metal sensor kinase
MKSIRLSLIVYFLVLLAVALGAVSGFVYESTHRSLLSKKATLARLLQDKEASTSKLVQTQYEDRCREERAKLDEALWSQARTLASLAQSQFQWHRLRLQALYVPGLMTAGLNPNGHVLMPLWLAEGYHRPLAYRLHRIVATEIRFNEDDLPRDEDGQVTEYFQINSEWGNTWRSRSMEDRSFPFDPGTFARARFLEWKFDEVEWEPGRVLRRITLKAPVSRFRVRWGHPPPDFRRSGPQPEGPPRPPMPPERFTEGSSLGIFIHCARDTTRLDTVLAGLQTERDTRLASLRSDLDSDLTQLDAESRSTLDDLRTRLLTIALVTFAATVLGGFWLVRLGLSPLRRLSDAVSQVSEKDFRLPFEESRLPGELQPIVERLKQTLELLQRAFTREKQAAADISHELRTPLAALLTTTEVALRKPRTPDEYRELLTDCRSMGQQMSQLVERLLALARLDAGVDTLRPQEVDAAALAEQCAALVRPLAEARDLSLQVECAKPAPLLADPDKLREILTNLLHNAIEYNRPQGSVAVSVQRTNGHLDLEVRDTGIGIAPQARARIFERFFRADPSREAVGLHAGLGLAIVKGYVDLMGGTIAVDSTEGQGSTFRVQLPAS